MALNVSTLEKGFVSDVVVEDGVTTVTWTAEAHGVKLEYVSNDPEADYWVSPIWNMRQKGVALVNKAGVMVANERRDR